MNEGARQPITSALAIAGLTCISSAFCSLLGCSSGLKILWWTFAHILYFSSLIGRRSGETSIEYPAIANAWSLYARRKLIMSENHMDKFLAQLSNCTDIENLIIKGHILTEHALNFYIQLNSVEKLDKNSRLNYATKIEIAQILGLFKTNKELKRDLKLLNKLRNSIAHNLNYDEKVFSELLLGTKKLKNELVNQMDNDSYVFIRNNEQKIFEKVNDTFVPLITGTKKISGKHIKFMSLISYSCGLIFSLAERNSVKNNTSSS